jgi:hypothetical protein
MLKHINTFLNFLVGSSSTEINTCNSIKFISDKSKAYVWSFTQNPDKTYLISYKGNYLSCNDTNLFVTSKIDMNCRWIIKEQKSKQYKITSLITKKPLIISTSDNDLIILDNLEYSSIYNSNKGYLTLSCLTVEELDNYKRFLSDLIKTLTLKDILKLGNEIQINVRMKTEDGNYVVFKQWDNKGTVFLGESKTGTTVIPVKIASDGLKFNNAVTNTDLPTNGMSIMWDRMKRKPENNDDLYSLPFSEYRFHLLAYEPYHGNKPCFIELNLTPAQKSQIYDNFMNNTDTGSPYRYLCCNENVNLTEEFRSSVCAMSNDYNRTEGQYQHGCSLYMKDYCSKDLSNPICACFSTYKTTKKLSEKEQLQNLLYQQSVKEGKTIPRQCIISECIDSSAYKVDEGVVNCPKQCVNLMDTKGGSGGIIDIGDNVKMQVICGTTTIVKPVKQVKYAYDKEQKICVKTTDGKYNSLKDCQKNHKKPEQVKYTYNEDQKICVKSSDGKYDTLSECQKDHEKPDTPKNIKYIVLILFFIGLVTFFVIFRKFMKHKYK